jgi:catechol 2,3-dioxygenase-like lactoylglutathione lyase family enzyme
MSKKRGPVGNVQVGGTGPIPACRPSPLTGKTCRDTTMKLLDGIHHLACLTIDMDRLIAFYGRVFDARVLVDLHEDGLRHAFIELGPRTVLHPFQAPGVTSLAALPMFQRGRLDHFAVNAASREAFHELHRRVVSEGAGNGVVTDMGSLLSFGFTDPDGGSHEVVWVKPGVPVGTGLRRDQWRRIELE